jgi:phosphatidylglycerol---prolipoprotein diacylglyceryl transferase
VTTLPWGWDYGDGLARHPIAVYEILGIGVLACVVVRGNIKTQPGDRFRRFVVGYLLLRIGLDFLKPPFGPASAGALAPDRWEALSVIQWACVAGVAYYVRDILRWATQGRSAVA